MPPPRPPKTPNRSAKKIKNGRVRDPIEVYCRVRPLSDEDDDVCVKVKDENTVVLVPPEVSQSSSGKVLKETHYSFKHVFDATTTQQELFNHVGLPLVKAALLGGNGLLFTYGISSSGKTYTMEGTPQDGGLLPRSLDVIFKSIKEARAQAKKYVFKPDKLNGFEVQSLADALSDQQKELGMYNRNKAKNKKEAITNRFSGDTRLFVEELHPNMKFSVFVSYVEIYNNYIFDLLDENTNINQKSSKKLHEDAKGNVYVSGVQENEVTTVDEALCLFYKGQDKRSIASTALNADSSRSHSIFTIRIVQAPVDSRGVDVSQDKDQIIVSQLSLVDLAGSERTKRTNNTGRNLTEAGSINNSLRILRNCIEDLRKFQTTGINKVVPYRDCKLTHLFKTFFEGEGKMRMIVCINPHVDNYAETVHVMQFAEITQEVEIARPTPISTPITPRYRFGHGALRQAGGVFENPVVYSLGPEFPELTTDDSDVEMTEMIINNLIEFLSARIARRNSLNEDLEQQQANFRASLIAQGNENHQLKQDNKRLQMDLEARIQQMHNLEQKLCSLEGSFHEMERHVNEYKKKFDNASEEVYRKDRMLAEKNQELERMKIRMQDEKAATKRQMKRVMDEKLAEVKRKMRLTADGVKQLRDIINADEWDEYLGDANIPRNANIPKAANVRFTIFPSTTDSESSGPVTRRKRRSEEMEEPVPETQVKTVADMHNNNPPKVQISSHSTKNASNRHVNKENRLPASSPNLRGLAVANPRHRRSASTGDAWIEHNPIGNLPLATILQPAMKKKKSVSKLEVKDVTNSERYVLQHQEQDSQGDVETQLFKGDIIPSAGGGAQVIFNDVEKLRQASPPTVYNLRKRSESSLPLRETEERCTVSVECHGLPPKISKK